jgi:CheY-like chemotaxis protein
LLAGRKLLLADDSVTIQKVIELTFADEGVRVVAFGNGQDAIDRLEELAPDIVLADVFMPSKNGYEVCEYVKQNEKLKAIPVMLLVGSFEPFDEAEARRVGADDILTKPFQSIRRLIDRVGALVNNPPVEKEVPTAELPKPEDSAAEPVRLSTEEIAITTADTVPLSEELHDTIEYSLPVHAQDNRLGEETIEDIATADVKEETNVESSDVLLDIDEYEPAHAAASDDFVLDLDMPDEEAFEDTLGGEVSAPAPMRAFVEPQVTETVASVAGPAFSYDPEPQAPSYQVAEVAYEDQVHEIAPEPVATFHSQPVVNDTNPLEERTPAAAPVAAGSLSQETIDAIARRVVEMMSEKVVQEIAWEVVPDLAELLIKRQLEEKTK